MRSFVLRPLPVLGTFLSLVCFPALSLSQDGTPPNFLELRLREPRDSFTDFDTIEVDLFLFVSEAEEQFLRLDLIEFCMVVDPDVPCSTRLFQRNPEIQPGGVCQSAVCQGRELRWAFYPTGLGCTFSPLIPADGLLLGTASLSFDTPPEVPTRYTVRCGVCWADTLSERPAILEYGGRRETVFLPDAEPLEVTVQRYPFVRGDTNLDAGLDISDPLRTLHTLFVGGDRFSFRCPNAADANDDDTVDVSDAIYTLEYLFLGGPPPPPPFPQPGYDPAPSVPENSGCHGL
jgi:hypothetical protein